MAVRDILTIPHETLYKPSEEITIFNNDGLKELIRDMFDTMYNARGVGLAAVQIGILKRLMVIDLTEMGYAKGVFINPTIADQSKDNQLGEEGCLSVPGLAADLERPQWVRIQYFDLKGKKQTITGKDLMARALLHEMDHMDGKVFIDQLEPDIRKPLEKDIKRIKKGKLPKGAKIPEYRRKTG